MTPTTVWKSVVSSIKILFFRKNIENVSSPHKCFHIIAPQQIMTKPFGPFVGAWPSGLKLVFSRSVVQDQRAAPLESA